jgi:protein-disulfide isomerase
MSTLRRSLALAVIVLLGLVALADAAYLTLVHVDLETGAGGIGRICHALSKTGCEVTGGRFGDVLGVPVAVIGGGGALAILVTAVVALVRRRDDAHPSHALLVGLAAVALLVSLLMATLSLVESAYCPFCVFWYLLNIATFAAAVAAADRSIAASLRASVGGLRRPVGVLAILVFAAGVGLGMTAYLRVLTRITDVVAVTVREEIDAALARPQITDLDLKDQPRRRVGGPGEAIEIVEFSDFECPYCRQLWVHAERYFAETDRPLEVVFVNYPLDAACNANSSGSLHAQACLAAYASECAHKQGKFWEYADRLFDRQPDLGRAALLESAGALGLDLAAFEACLDDPATAEAVKIDVNLGTKARVRGTPSMLIGGYKLSGVIRRPFFEGMLSKIQGS